jgi:hypothetical protein
MGERSDQIPASMTRNRLVTVKTRNLILALPIRQRNGVVMSLRGSEMTDAISQPMGKKEIAALSRIKYGVARNDKMGLRHRLQDGAGGFGLH